MKLGGRTVKAWVQPTTNSIQISLVNEKGDFTGERWFLNRHDYEALLAGKLKKADGSPAKACPCYLSDPITAAPAKAPLPNATTG